MTGPQLLVLVATAAAVVLGVTCLLLARAVRRDRERTASALADARAEAADLRARLDALAVRLDRPERESEEFVITRVGESGAEPAEPLVPERIDGRLFADIVLRESLVKAASLGHGVRRALAAETRNRIRFEMRREVKRSRKQRRAELKELRRNLQARQREQEVA